jgi:hypothetical protein
MFRRLFLLLFLIISVFFSKPSHALFEVFEEVTDDFGEWAFGFESNCPKEVTIKQVQQNQIQESGNFEVWKEKTFDSLYEWRKRIEFLHRQVEVMIRLTREPINPKFPSSSSSATDVLKRF